MEDQMAGLNIEGEDDEIFIDDEVAEESSVSVDLCLVGRFITEQPINFTLMRSRMAGVWRPGKGVFMKDIGQGRFIFQFFHEVDLKRVYDGGPWAFGNFPLILHRLRRGEFPLTVPLDILPFWVQIHDLPAGYLTEGVGKLLGNFIGKFMEYDSTNSTGVWRQYMRVRVGVRVSEPLKHFKKLKNRDGSTFVVKFKYERLNIFCFLCGRLGHSESFCEMLFNPEAKDTERQWGVELKAADRKGVGLAGEKWIRTEDAGANPSGESADARVSSEPLQMDPKKNAQENRGESSLVTSLGCFREDIPILAPRYALQDISTVMNSPQIMQLENYSMTANDERKRRRGIDSSDVGTTLALEIFPAGQAKDVSDAPSNRSTGPGTGVGRAQ
ncbi:uncharacterized protein LOC131025974 [Salvia miltiorrhiza]|uniref:uncharacterized protein LOC131025974 n=1 Tax=Salvia miltiorrhiza TaxID=226208 RepID=UPI0025AB856A|nr:uncharacterized protein LOC131025974 [Salvia miltiorrhiza]